MNARNACLAILLSAVIPGCSTKQVSSNLTRKPIAHGQEAAHTMFLPPGLNDEWTTWILGEWAGSGDSSAGKGKGRVTFELGLGGQFLICRGVAELTELQPDYLREHLNASDEEIARFAQSGYESVEFYTLDQESGEVVSFLFDNLRCIATGRGRREGFKETIHWEWQNGYRSTRLTQRLAQDQLSIIERTPLADGTVMEDRGEMLRVTKNPTAPH